MGYKCGSWDLVGMGEGIQEGFGQLEFANAKIYGVKTLSQMVGVFEVAVLDIGFFSNTTC